MRRKTQRKLHLHRETLRTLNAPTLRRIVGGAETMDGNCTQVDSHCPINTCTCEVCEAGIEVG